jgi:hypothetical protein
VRRSHEAQGGEAPGYEVPLPGLAEPESQLAVPGMALGQLVCVLAIESARQLAFDELDESLLVVVATMVASAIEIDNAQERASEPPAVAPGDGAETSSSPAEAGPTTRVRYFAVDGSTFLDGDYLIKGVAGRILWKLLRDHAADGRDEFTNKEVRLDPSLELPSFRDNLESRLILLKRRLDERGAPIRIEKTGRGRFRLAVDGTVELDGIDA